MPGVAVWGACSLPVDATALIGADRMKVVPRDAAARAVALRAGTPLLRGETHPSASVRVGMARVGRTIRLGRGLVSQGSEPERGRADSEGASTCPAGK